MKFGVLQFPASNCDQDAIHAIHNLGHEADYIWHKEETVGDAQAIIVPGGFSYGDYLRCGAVARFSPVMQAVKKFADDGGLVIGICNGFQVLCEAGLLPGALVRNKGLQFRCEQVLLKTANRNTAFTSTTGDQLIRIPIAHGEGCYFADDETMKQLRDNNQILWQYANEAGELTDEANPNGSIDNVAGISNATHNVAGLMPHPERACQDLLDSADGNLIFESMIQKIAGQPETAAA